MSTAVFNSMSNAPKTTSVSRSGTVVTKSDWPTIESVIEKPMP